MCIQLVERYAACGCIYTVHGIDACSLYGRHAVTENTVYVGYKCPTHAGRSHGDMRRTQSARKAFRSARQQQGAAMSPAEPASAPA